MTGTHEQPTTDNLEPPEELLKRLVVWLNEEAGEINSLKSTLLAEAQGQSGSHSAPEITVESDATHLSHRIGELAGRQASYVSLLGFVEAVWADRTGKLDVAQFLKSLPEETDPDYNP